MIPEYCVRELANTGGSVAPVLILAIGAALVGATLVVRRRSRAGLAVVLALVLVPALLAIPHRAEAGAAKQCPAGYRYVAALDTDAQNGSTQPVPAPPEHRSDHDESWMRPRTVFTLKADGTTGLTATGEDLPNWDIARATIRAYMNAGRDGIADKSESPYIADVTAITTARADEIAAACTSAAQAGKKPAAVFDADDTTLWTYDMEDGAMHFAFTHAKQQEWFDHHQMPATPGMVALVTKVHAAGCDIIGLTGRNDAQKDYTLKNLADAGYVDDSGAPLFTADKYYTKFLKTAPMPDYLAAQGRCDTANNTCTTVQFKAGTRQHLIEDLGYTIVGNFGDQWSDLQGGYADSWIKLPNATYYLPSPDLPEAEAADAAAGMAPPEATYELAPDGSSGRREGVKDHMIPNMDIVKKTLRTYYGATKDDKLGQYVADTSESPYISDVTAVVDRARTEVVANCRAAVARGERPAITLDADDTTLWTYDMEEWMEFTFSPEKQTEYLKTDYHALPATPGMVGLVHAAKDAGCEIIGLTGRSDSLKEVTQRNMDEVGYPSIDPALYFTKTSSSAAELPAWVTCAEPKCTTIEFKSSVRKHIEDDLGYRIVGNFGDQYSDLIGGHADVAYKLPNPTYYLP
ncbi:LPXTG cell wall anchor domain-containing protein [Actinomyces sp. B33]|uniref:HAD family acid phosphatase n=1 Tax=Actinomyces sp. B33 TaxID=2942131 RepID=UPI0023401B05|nr:HAD family acid phosphatase [Actinomyces sp. B33]MDC4232210.1 LPXTG cell wall anchor domain-containing protein [Actinomyces sp. B33]